MMRGVYWPLATWIATSSEPKVEDEEGERKRDDRAAQRLRTIQAEARSAPVQPRIERVNDRGKKLHEDASGERNDPERRAEIALDAIALLPGHAQSSMTSPIAGDTDGSRNFVWMTFASATRWSSSPCVRTTRGLLGAITLNQCSRSVCPACALNPPSV